MPHSSPPPPLSPDESVTPTFSALGSHQFLDSIDDSTDKVFFISYTPTNTLLPRWYLAQVDLKSTADLKLNPAATSQYWCVFQARHPSDATKSDEEACWWPEWYRYHVNPTSSAVVYGDRVLIRPDQTPSAKKYVQWATSLILHIPESCALVGPFNFKKMSIHRRVRRILNIELWTKLTDLCIESHLLLPPAVLALHTYLHHVRRGTNRKRIIFHVYLGKKPHSITRKRHSLQIICSSTHHTKNITLVPRNRIVPTYLTFTRIKSNMTCT